MQIVKEIIRPTSRVDVLSRVDKRKDISSIEFRQVHMDFHTSEMLSGVGAKFNAEDFAETLAKAKVNSVTCFSRCHHGWLYYQSKLYPERIHPGLGLKNLLAEQIEACHKKNIKVPIYTTVRWDNYSATRHPEWLVKKPGDEKIKDLQPCDIGFYKDLCLNSEYVDFLISHISELLENYKVDGLFLDIVNEIPCVCENCVKKMFKMDLDYRNQDDIKEFAILTIKNFKQRIFESTRKLNKTCTIFFNSGHIGTTFQDYKDYYTHLELESLPGGQWGYGHFPTTVRYARTLGKDCVGMTGKFHTAWGDFHSFKNKAALEYECFRMLAFNCKCSIGDQLHPEGTICKDTYKLVGDVFSQIEQKEPWCKDATALSDIGVLHPEEFLSGHQSMFLSDAISGLTRMLQENSRQFDILDSQADFSKYKLLILPDHILVDKNLSRKLSSYLKNGGKLIASFESGLNQDKSEFSLKEFGVLISKEQPLNYQNKPVSGNNYFANNFTDFIVPKDKIGKGLPCTEHVMYIRGLNFTPFNGAEILAESVSSYFDRDGDNFCSHRHTPSSRVSHGPAITKNKNVIYFGHPIFKIYGKFAPNWCKKLLLNAIDMLVDKPLLSHNGPSFLLTTINEQSHQNRYVLHLLSYIPEKRCDELEIIEEPITCCDVTINLAVPKKVKKVLLVPEMRSIDFQKNSNGISFLLDKFTGHRMVSLLY